MGLGGLIVIIRDQLKTPGVPATTPLHWQDPSLGTECKI